MSSFAKLVAVLAASLLITAVAAQAGDEKSKKSGAGEAGDRKKDDKKQEKSSGQEAAPKAIDVPMPNGRDAKGIKIPYFDTEGKLQMRFDIGVATRIDDNHIQMSRLQVETFDDTGEREMVMDLPASVLDLTTSVITAEQPVTIKSDDFELTGQTMTFNTKTKQGGLGGKVRMLIYNLEDQANTTSDTPKTPAK